MQCNAENPWLLPPDPAASIPQVLGGRIMSGINLASIPPLSYKGEHKALHKDRAQVLSKMMLDTPAFLWFCGLLSRSSQFPFYFIPFRLSFLQSCTLNWLLPKSHDFSATSFFHQARHDVNPGSPWRPFAAFPCNSRMQYCRSCRAKSKSTALPHLPWRHHKGYECRSLGKGLSLPNGCTPSISAHTGSETDTGHASAL